MEQKIADLQNQLNTYPEGNFYCVQNGHYSKWYFHTEEGTTYIPKSQISTAREMAYAKYLFHVLQDLKLEQKSISLYLKHYSSSSKPKHLFEESPDYANLLSSYIQPESYDLSTWQSAPYEHNSEHPSQLIHKCFSGNTVRSKSEVLIDTALFLNKIPYRYECALHINNLTLYPDFTIRHPLTGSLYYWEHFGLIDHASYRQNTFSKMEIYCANGIIPSINLITTFETKDTPLSADLVDKLVKYYFL